MIIDSGCFDIVGRRAHRKIERPERTRIIKFVANVIKTLKLFNSCDSNN